MSDEIRLTATPKPPQKRGFLGLFGAAKPKTPKPNPNAKATSMSILSGLSASWSTEEAFVAILYATALVDGEVHAKEWEEMKALSHRVKVFEKKTDAEIDAILEKVKAKMTWDRKGEFPWSQVDGACQALGRKALGLTVFANACDIVFADRTIEQAEVDLLNRISDKMSLDAAQANTIIDVMKIKNAHN